MESTAERVARMRRLDNDTLAAVQEALTAYLEEIEVADIPPEDKRQRIVKAAQFVSWLAGEKRAEIGDRQR